MKRFLLLLSIVGFLSGSLFAQEPVDKMTLQTIDGKTLHITGTTDGLKVDEYKGKVVFLEFWGTRCPPCKMSIPHYINLMKKFKGKLAMLAVEVQATPKDRLKRFVKAHKINYDVVAHEDAEMFVDYIAQRTQWNGSIPFLLIFDQQGRVVTIQVGMLRESSLAGIVKTLTSSKKSSK